MRSIAYFIAGAVVATATLGIAEARRHHRGGAHCRLGQIYIVHEGACVSRASAARVGIIRSARSIRRKEPVYYATIQVKEEPSAPEPPRRPPAPPEIKCTDWNPDPVGWPGAWVYNKGLAKYPRERF